MSPLNVPVILVETRIQQVLLSHIHHGILSGQSMGEGVAIHRRRQNIEHTDANVFRKKKYATCPHWKPVGSRREEPSPTKKYLLVPTNGSDAPSRQQNNLLSCWRALRLSGDDVVSLSISIASYCPRLWWPRDSDTHSATIIYTKKIEQSRQGGSKKLRQTTIMYYHVATKLRWRDKSWRDTK